MSKKIFSIIIMVLLLLGLCGTVFAKDTYTATSTINGVTVNWEYELNNSNQIENLKCTNSTDLTGNVKIPANIDGKTVVTLGDEAFKSAKGITEITIPNSVTEIGYSAFENCTKLNKVDLGNITAISFSVFKGCTSLTEITIPKTLKKGSVSPCLDNPNITKITLEEGLTVVPTELCANTGITEITIPNSVTEIGYSAFENCTKLNKVDLGNITAISFSVFKGCTSLTEITIPKTLKKGSVSPCLDNPNITKITLEEGLTVVPTELCANTGITEITIPNSVTEIGYSAFENCTKLNKITILDNVQEMGFYNISNSDSIFKNHNEDLTIYCYKDSMAANYAIKYNIKYVYLTQKDINDKTNSEEKQDDKNSDITETTINKTQKDTTTATGELPQTGVSSVIIISFIVVTIISIAIFKKYNSYKDIN